MAARVYTRDDMIFSFFQIRNRVGIRTELFKLQFHNHNCPMDFIAVDFSHLAHILVSNATYHWSIYNISQEMMWRTPSTILLVMMVVMSIPVHGHVRHFSIQRLVNKEDTSSMEILVPTKSNFTSSLYPNTLAGQTQYSVTVSVGTPTRDYLLVIDTGSSDIWIQGQDCQHCSTSQSIESRFNISRSSTFINQCQVSGLMRECEFELKYGSGGISGQIGRDHIAIGDFDFGHQLLHMGITTNEGGDIARILGASGILGLAFTNLATFTTPAVTAYMDSFALSLEPDGGHLSINGILEKYQDENYHWATVPIETYDGMYTYWAVGLPILKFGNSDLCGASPPSVTSGWEDDGVARCKVVLDSGTGLIAAPQKIWSKIKRVFETAGCRPLGNTDSGMHQCPRSAVPSFSIVLGSYVGFPLTLPLEAYTLETKKDDPFVIVGIVESPLPDDLWVFGSIFLEVSIGFIDLSMQILFLNDLYSVAILYCL